MVSLHYYSLLLIVATALYYALDVLLYRASSPLRWKPLAAAFALSVAPVALWMLFAPGFRETIEVVLREADKFTQSGYAFLIDLWRDLTFGAIRWQPGFAGFGLLLAPLFLIGMFDLLWNKPQDRSLLDRGLHWGWLIALIILIPLLVSVLKFRTLSTRYLLYIVPFIYTVIALAIIRLVDHFSTARHRRTPTGRSRGLPGHIVLFWSLSQKRVPRHGILSVRPGIARNRRHSA